MISVADTIKNNLQTTLSRIRNASLLYGRSPSEVQLLVVSKAQTAEKLRYVYAAGQNNFGENYLQEAMKKMAQLNDCRIIWHFIGSIQSNKTKLIAEHFSWVHSVDRLKIAQRLNEARSPLRSPLNICLQININHEESKSGLSLAELPEIATQIKQLPNVKLRGLMALPALSTSFESQRENFSSLRYAFNELNQQGLKLDTLSMGMSNDLEAAIAEGTTIVRIGRAIFGPRH